MVTIIDVAERKNQQGVSFTALILGGGVEMVRSKNKGKYYATVRKASVPSTLDLSLAKTLIGQRMPGTIQKIPSEPYKFTTQKGEEIEIDFTYEYTEETSNFVETVLGEGK